MRNFYTPIILILLIISVYLGYQFIESDNKQNIGQIDCDFTRSGCFKTYNFGVFELNASPNIIKAENEIFFSLISKSKHPIKIKSAWLEGKEMFMGKIPLFFEENSGVFTTNTLIGACTKEQMIWTMFVEVQINDKIETLMFDFVSYQ
ncbi:hypothetical protein RGQ13_09100 [Thalassotalea psychrophila]|uniref:Periplasmic protein n=1 Tax=Thalassotalea psychrophila TaxID=3065647 RepID=A0ABY9U0T1_9GAMM|nr:hypothetical protein RGQ13_09100 [Colwelliaceae bacterium SQ149]